MLREPLLYLSLYFKQQVDALFLGVVAQVVVAERGFEHLEHVHDPNALDIYETTLALEKSS